MAEQQQQQNGYLTASQLLTDAINNGVSQGVTIDEMFAALSVQREVINLRLSQIMIENHQRQAVAAYQAQQAAAAGQSELPLEGENNAN